ncbi:two-component regulator propeller domain-containing protein [Pedobacter sp. P351]|uniref:hybrid sensor histidine kinase/response regulator transcription factor n=1 Tax=Pedobacter superstes TaxID=3133441 RepID=UPI0030A7B331
MCERFRACIYILLIQVFCVQAYCQVITNVRHYSTADGLSDNKVTSITKDSEGFMWFGSWSGITRFDGNNFLVFKSSPGDSSSLKSNRIDDIIEDPGETSHLWVKAYDNVYRFDKRTQRFIAIAELLDDTSLRKVSFTKILAVKEGRVWLKTENEGLFLITNSSGSKPHCIRISKESGVNYRLPANAITFFHLDKFNNAWIGTALGLRVLKYKPKGGFEIKMIQGLGKEAFTGITENKNLVWLGTDRGYLLSIDRSLKIGKAYKISNSRLNHISVSRDLNKVYCSTSDGMLISVSGNGKSEVLARVTDKSPLLFMYEDRFSNLWIESNSFCLVKYSPIHKKLTYFFPRSNYQFKATSRNFVIFEDKNGRVWINIKGLKGYNSQKEIFEAPVFEYKGENENLSRIKNRYLYDPAGVLWVLPDDGGVEKILFKEHDFRQFLPQANLFRKEDGEIRGIYTDRRNRLWMGTKSGDLLVYKNNTRIENILINKPKFETGVYSIVEDRRGRLWIGTKGDGLFKADPIDPEGNKYQVTRYLSDGKFGSISNSSFYCLLVDKKGRVWAGTFGAGLILIQEKNGKAVFTTNTSFNKYPKNGYQRIRHLAEDANGRIWIGTTEGLLVFDPNSGSPENYEFRRYEKEPGNINSLGGNDVQFLFKDSRNQMWVLTSSGGLNLALGTNPLKSLSFLNYSTRDGLPSDFLLSCAEDNQRNLWIATQNGIAKFALDKKKFQNFNHYNGLSKASFSEASCTKTMNGDLFFGTTIGCLMFSPSKIQTEKVNVKLAFTGFQVNGEEVVPGNNSPLAVPINNSEKVVLNHDQNSFSIEFALLDYHSMEKRNYASRLLGLDDVWSNTRGQRRATYSKLSHGNYVFEVKSLNEELYKNAPIRSLHITILPPPWKTWWAYLIYILIIVVLFILIRRTILTVLGLRQQIEIDSRVAELKLKFFTQISHELRTPLTLIVNPAEEVLKQENLSVKGREYLNTVVKNSRRMVRLVNHLLDLRKVQSGKATLRISKVEIVSFLKDMRTYFSDVLRERNLRVEVVSEFSELVIPADKEKLDIVFYNLLANAIKFSPDKSHIQIIIKSGSSGFLRVEIVDEGVGVAENELKDIFELYYEGEQLSDKPQKGTGIGLALSKELVELHGGFIRAENNSSSGLKVIVELKVDNIDSHSEEVHSTYGQLTQVDYEELSPATIEGNEDRPLVLLVEDNDELRTFLAGTLVESYRVETANNGAEGLEKARDLLPDLILTDIMMPVLNGIQLLERVKGDLATSHIPVILLTARYSVESQIQGLNYGADYYVTKPFQMELLQAAISNIINRRKKLFQNLVEGTKDELNGSDQFFISPQDKAFLEKIIAIVEDKLDDVDFNIDDVAGSIRMSRSGFFKKFKSLTNIAPVEFVRETRLKKAKDLFNAGEDNVSTVAYTVGFNNPKYFSTCFKAQYQQTPSEYLKTLKKTEKKEI